ncbi:hypothetical protein RvY_04913 [Ramazzottius varieornatus]|uniref:Uncharacterized protein n=1 Tax=Ramazzottius varieornatus TaxID=947166 RepID=A0A1D1UYY2_RAMVA|nr:hypothetical protein RvY_04913 [Ramazzottius varieornatus]
MESVNPLNILNLLLFDYEQHFQLSDSPSESDKMLRILIKDFLDVQIDQAGSSISATEDLQYELPIGVSTFDQLEKSIAETNLFHGRSEADFESTPNDRLTEPASSGTEPSAHELFVPRIPNPKKRRSLASVQDKFREVASTRQLREWRDYVEEGGSRIDKLKAIRLKTGEEFFLAKQKPNVVKDLDIQQYYNICDRKIKFVTEKYLKEQETVSKILKEEEMKRNGWTKPPKRLPAQCLPSVRTQANIRKVKKAVLKKIPDSQRKLARKLGCSVGSVSKIVYENLGLKVRKKTKVDHLTDVQKKQRYERGKLFIQYLGPQKIEKILTMDETWITLDDCNSEKEYYYTDNFLEIPKEWRKKPTKHWPKKIMVVIGISWKGMTKA